MREWRKQHQSATTVAGEIPARVREALERAGFLDELRQQLQALRRRPGAPMLIPEPAQVPVNDNPPPVAETPKEESAS